MLYLWFRYRCIGRYWVVCRFLCLLYLNGQSITSGVFIKVHREMLLTYLKQYTHKSFGKHRSWIPRVKHYYWSSTFEILVAVESEHFLFKTQQVAEAQNERELQLCILRLSIVDWKVPNAREGQAPVLERREGKSWKCQSK